MRRLPGKPRGNRGRQLGGNPMKENNSLLRSVCNLAVPVALLLHL